MVLVEACNLLSAAMTMSSCVRVCHLWSLLASLARGHFAAQRKALIEGPWCATGQQVIEGSSILSCIVCRIEKNDEQREGP